MVLHKILYFSKVGKLGEKREGDGGGGGGWGVASFGKHKKTTPQTQGFLLLLKLDILAVHFQKEKEELGLRLISFLISILGQ